MKNIPKKIYLQIGENADVTIDKEINDFNELYQGAISWADEKINDNDIEYFKSDYISKLDFFAGVACGIIVTMILVAIIL